MVYFIPHWSTKERILDEDRVLNILNLFQENKLEAHLIVVEYLPYFRYLLNDYRLHDIQVLSLFDILQQVEIETGFPMTVEDLSFESSVEQIYTPYGITLIKDRMSYGEVRFEEHGFVQSVQYPRSATCLCTELYDDRGFLSSIIFSDRTGEKQKQEFYNPLGKCVMTEYFGSDAHIELYHFEQLGLKQARYLSFSEIFAELFNQGLVDFGQSSLIFDSWGFSLDILERLTISQPIMSIFSTEKELNQYTEKQLAILFSKSKVIITDSRQKKSELLHIKEQQRIIGGDIVDIPMYPTRLALGNSNSVERLMIYWKDHHAHQEEEFLVHLLTNLLIQEVSYGLIVEVSSLLQEQKIEVMQKQLIDAHFNVDSDSAEFRKVAAYLQAKDTNTLMKTQADSVKELKLLPIWRQYVQAVELYERIEFRINPNIKQVQTDLSIARLYLDVNQKPDLQKQSFAVNAGIPLILKEESDYVIHMENGYNVDHISEVSEILTFYMNGLKNWNETLVKNVAMIETHSSYNLLEKWRKLFDDGTEKN